MMANRIDGSIRRAEDATSDLRAFPGTCDTVRRDVAIGDPQASRATFFGVLDRHELLGEDGTLADGVHLVSLGDHFDFGDDPEIAARDGLQILSWLAAHDPSRVTILAGNHDLGRVGELADVDDDATFARIRERAVEVYRGGGDEPALLEAYPMLPSAELAARDFSAFTVAQRELVTRLLRSGRMTFAAARRENVLLCHAGVTRRDLDRVEIFATDAPAIAAALDERLAAAVANWRGGPLVIPGLHTPGSAADGEGGGVLYHRPRDSWCDPHEFDGPFRRRFDPRQLPAGIIEVVGHIRDGKCRELLGPYCDDAPAEDGPLRHLHVAPGRMRYRRGAIGEIGEDERALVFVDGGMGYGGGPRYELLDLTTMAPLA